MVKLGIGLIVSGLIVVLLSMFGVVFEMTSSFGEIAASEDSPSPSELSEGINSSLWYLIGVPVGIGLAVVGVVLLVRARRRRRLATQG